MTQKQIENEAREWSSTAFGKGGHFAKEDALMLARISAGRKAFQAGAEWRIASVWHDRAENASMGNGEIVFVFPDDKAMTTSILGWSWDDIKSHFKFVKWAYIKDLLPTEDAL